MKKVNRKIISIFLLLIIIASQMGSAVIATEDTSITLEQYLIENGVDKDGDKKISDAEWANVKNLYMFKEYYNIKDIKNIEKAINLEHLYINNIEGFNTIDFSKLQNLEFLFINYDNDINDLDFSKIFDAKKLSALCISYAGNMSTLDFSKLANLKALMMISNIKKMNLPKFNNIDYIYIECTYVEDNQKKIADFNLDLENCPNVEGGIAINDRNKLKLNDNTLTSTYSWDKDVLNLTPAPDNIKVYKDGKKFELSFNEVECENNNIIKISKGYNKYYISGENIGTKNITITDSLNRKKNVKVEVIEKPKSYSKPVDTKLENTGVTARFVSNNTILKSNGELWQVNSPTTAEKIDTNVKDFKKCISYPITYDAMIGEPHMKYNKLYKDNTLTIEIIDIGNEIYASKESAVKKIKDVKEIGPNVYLNTNGELFEIIYNSITEEIYTKKIMENVKKIVDYCIVLEDGTTLCQDQIVESNNSDTKYVEIKRFYKLADFEIKATGKYKVEGKWYRCVVDMNNNLYGCEESIFLNLPNQEKVEMKLLKENFNDFYIKYNELDQILKDPVTNNPNLNDVVQESSLELENNDADILIRTDGTIWTYSDEWGLTKITESTSGDDKEENKNFLNPTAKVHEKELGNTSILYGISNSTKVEDLKKQNNFNSTYEVKIYDKNDKELQDNNIIGTGSKVKLYKQGKIVKEYTVILYGDTTGDGKITSVDALAIIKHINNKIPFTKEEYIEAGKVRKESGKDLTSVDALATVKSVNGKYEITKNK